MTGTLYRHSKGNLYCLVGRGTHSETHEPMVIYQEADTEALWVRPARMWDEEVTWPDGQKRPRFVPEGTGVKEKAMPDANKVKKLRAIGYTIPGLCGYCKHSNFEGPTALNGWGACDLHTYRHLKHGKGRGVSIHATGTCPQFEWDPSRVAQSGLGAHQEFIHVRPREADGS